MNFLDAVRKDQIRTTTTNGMRARTTSSNPLVDLFSAIGSSRGMDLTDHFLNAYRENPEVALRILLWARDVRGGAGERNTFRKLLGLMEIVAPEDSKNIMSAIPELGRWDDLFAYKNPANKEAVVNMIHKALLEEGNGLCAKWMPREKGTKSALAKELREALGLTPREYRKMLVGLTKVVEQDMCAKKWEEINFSHVPSVASARYQKAFGRHAPEAYSAYLKELQKPVEDRDPKVKINAGAIFPYDVVKSVNKGNAAVADEQWKALPNYMGDKKILPLVDVSGSMQSPVSPGLSALEVAVSLGLYCSTFTSSAFKDLFLTFSAKPAMVHVTGSLSDKIRKMKRSNWGMNTNLEAAFEEILRVAKRGKVKPEDMPEYLLIISDMQFDYCMRKPNDSALSMLKRMYREDGYELPQVIFWNLTGAKYGNTPVKFDKDGTALVSGFSPALLKTVLAVDLENFTPYNVMLQTVMNDRYDYRKYLTSV